jgi:hypothetical protein
MRTLRFFMLLVYVAGNSGLTLALPLGNARHACRCGDNCSCTGTGNAGACGSSSSLSSSCFTAEMSTATNSTTTGSTAKGCCESEPAAAQQHPEKKACCAGKSCCEEYAADSSDCSRERVEVLLPCRCGQDSASVTGLCGDPRLVPRRVAWTNRPIADRVSPGAGTTAPQASDSPEEPVPRPGV